MVQDMDIGMDIGMDLDLRIREDQRGVTLKGLARRCNATLASYCVASWEGGMITCRGGG